ncbi:Gfo/Idh/MocA family oxidoreductase [Fulvivirgaceae bacterium BMA12]|uniref:Gfo/Idh/MocA family oxidoreductase n=1 Tax=Agaribacillus aureus TaxID=3051825 RepID=A0ABT8L902_9BACT|nr:Gfo/Idh/MocA family oxidoreductase [Fulvivirgaceae bacterium BMA12]
MINTGVIGYGYWGPNIVRNFVSNENLNVVKVSDIAEDRLKLLSANYPDIKAETEAESILNDPDIELVAIITSTSTHFKLAKQALLNGKHIFVEKPFTATVAEAEELIEIAEKKGLLIMVDHTFLFTGAVRKMKELVESGELGSLYYYDSVRVNLGLFQYDANVIWDLAPHDLSIMNFLNKDIKPVSVNAVGADHIGKGFEDVAYLTVKCENNFIGHFHANWLSPVKVRKTLVAGDKKMLVWDDLEADEKIKIYNKRVEEVQEKSEFYKLQVKYHSGDILVPVVEMTEALKLEAAHLVDCIQNKTKPINGGLEGLQVVKILEASDISLRNGGKEVKL